MIGLIASPISMANNPYYIAYLMIMDFRVLNYRSQEIAQKNSLFRLFFDFSFNSG